MPLTIDSRSLQLGDIIITSKDHLVSHCGIVAGTTNVQTGNGTVTRADGIYHATSSKGVSEDQAGQWADDRPLSGVFRCKSLRFLTYGNVGAAQKIADAAKSLASRCSYGKGRAFFKSWTGTSTYGDAAKGRVAKYLERLGAGGPFITTLYCSEYVVLSYQIAAKGDEATPFFIDLDGKHTLPKDLRNWILQRATPGGSWSYLGDLVR